MIPGPWVICSRFSNQHFCMRYQIASLMALLMVTGMKASAELRTRTVEYTVAGVVMEGYLAYDDSFAGRRPGVLVVHDWMGVAGHARDRADALAKLGYVAFAADMYGKGVRPANGAEASKLAGALKGDRPLMRQRIAAALDVLRRNELVGERVAAIGYCFGGTVALELARGGADVAGVVSFHGGLDTPNPEATAGVKARVLVLHGADDPFVPAQQVAAFQEEMRRCGADWQLIAYGGAVHSFTNPAAGNDNSRGAAYNASADRRSWAAMRSFFDEILK